MPTPNPGSHDYALLQIANACKEWANTYQSEKLPRSKYCFFLPRNDQARNHGCE